MIMTCGAEYFVLKVLWRDREETVTVMAETTPVVMLLPHVVDIIVITLDEFSTEVAWVHVFLETSSNDMSHCVRTLGFAFIFVAPATTKTVIRDEI